MTEPERLSISEVSRFVDVPIPTIRSWERRYGVPAPARTGGGHRRYTREEVDLIRAMRDEIVRGASARDAARRIRLAPAPAIEPTPHLETLLDRVLDLDDAGIRGSLDQAADGLGIERAVVEVALPALREVGDRWAGGRCDVAQEHLATNEVRSWIARLGRTAPPPFRPAPILLAAAPDETHATGLEAFALLLARRGWPTVVLGARIPVDSLLRTVSKVGPAAVVLSSQWTRARRSALEALEAVAATSVPVFYAGAAFAVPSKREGVPGVYLGDALLDSLDELERKVA
ncbi:MAG TPA: B12-binding domain-containing protein [Actinomycetota bacterium]